MNFEAVLYFSVDDPESVARFRVTCNGPDHATALQGLLDAFRSPDGFTLDDLVQVVITRQPPEVATNLLAHRP